MAPKGFPVVHFYDQSFIDMYDQIWIWIQDMWKEIAPGSKQYALLENDFDSIELESALMSTLFLAYSNQNYNAYSPLDFFYSKMEASGAIRSSYTNGDISKGFESSIPAPLFAWIELGLYHKIGGKKRLKEVIDLIEKNFMWTMNACADPSGLLRTPAHAEERPGVVPGGFSIAFNAQMALAALSISQIGSIINDKDIDFRYKKIYFSLKMRINKHMWNEENSFYHNLQANLEQTPQKVLGAYWVLLAELPSIERAQVFIDHLRNPESFGTDNPFPSLSADDPDFDPAGGHYKGAVYPELTFMVIKGLEAYKEFTFARELAICHIYFIIDTLHPDDDVIDTVYQAYKPHEEGPAVDAAHPDFPKRHHVISVGLPSIVLMIETILGFNISLPRKTVEWTMANVELMGIEDLSLKRNKISVTTNKRDARGWEIRLTSEKLYYFTLNLLDTNKVKTLPIPSGRCSMLIDKL